MMPKRRRTRTQDRANRIATERRANHQARKPDASNPGPPHPRQTTIHRRSDNRGNARVTTCIQQGWRIACGVIVLIPWIVYQPYPPQT